MNKTIVSVVLLLTSICSVVGQKSLTEYVNPFLGTAPLTNPADIGFTPPWRVWVGLTFPGASLPNAMVQLCPITKFGSGAGYEYENPLIYAFAHSNKGHWNLCNIPILPVSGDVNPTNFGSTFNHTNESAHPGYYQVFLERYKIDAELTTTPRCGYHRYTYSDDGQTKKLVVNLAVSNERIRDWNIYPDGDHAFKGYQVFSETAYFYAESNYKIEKIKMLNHDKRGSAGREFCTDGKGPLEIKIGISLCQHGECEGEPGKGTRRQEF